MEKYAVGDRVSVAHGEYDFKGTIESMWENGLGVKVKIDQGRVCNFQFRQLRKLKPKPNKKKHRIEGWVNVWSENMLTGIFCRTRHEADKMNPSANPRTVCARAVIEWES